MKTVYCECLVAKCLLDAPFRGVDETDIMKEVWSKMNTAIKKGKMIDIPLRRESTGRIPFVVETLKTWLGRGVIRIIDNDTLRFKINDGDLLSWATSRHILQETIDDYPK